MGQWVCQRAGGDFRVGGSAVGLEKHGQLVAGVIFDNFNGASLYMHVAAEGKHWLNREFLWFTFYYAFTIMRANVLIGLVGSKNDAALHFDKNLGFVETCRIPGAHPDGELVILTMTQQQCRFLVRRKRVQAQCTSYA